MPTVFCGSEVAGGFVIAGSFASSVFRSANEAMLAAVGSFGSTCLGSGAVETETLSATHTHSPSRNSNGAWHFGHLPALAFAEALAGMRSLLPQTHSNRCESIVSDNFPSAKSFNGKHLF